MRKGRTPFSIHKQALARPGKAIMQRSFVTMMPVTPQGIGERRPCRPPIFGEEDELW
jgi:hypothetical protein